MKILKCSDTIKITTKTESPISVTVRPLTVSEKMEISSKTKMVKGEEVGDGQAQTYLVIKNCFKSIEGVQNYDGTEYVPEIVDGKLSDSSVDDITTLLSEAELMVPFIRATNKSINLEGYEVQVNPK